jgi:hypothetical protein
MPPALLGSENSLSFHQKEGWYHWEGRGSGEEVKEDEYGANIVYTTI